MIIVSYEFCSKLHYKYRGYKIDFEKRKILFLKTFLFQEKKLDERVVLAAELTDVRERLEIRDVQYRDLIHRLEKLFFLIKSVQI